MDTKICGRCNVCKPCGEFNKKATAKDGRQSYCRECNRARSRKYYLDNHKHHLKVIQAGKRRRKKELRKRISAIKAANGCSLCSENEPICLEFHHPNSAEKVFAIGSFFVVTWKWATILAEIKKCVLLCSNCHKKVHGGIRSIDVNNTCNVDKWMEEEAAWDRGVIGSAPDF